MLEGLSVIERNALIGALYTAADRYRQNAADVKRAWGSSPAAEPLSKLFLTQAEEVGQLLTKLE